MRLTVTVVSPATGRQADVAIEAGPGTTLAQVAGELDRLMHGMPAAVPITGPEPWVPALFVGGHRVPGDMRLAGSPLLDGCVVSLGDPSGCPRPEPPGVAELRVAGGPAAGGVYRLVPGMTDIGGLAADDALVAGGPDIEIADPAVSPLAMRVIIGAGGWQLRRSAACRSWWTGSRWTGPIAARWQAGGSGSSGSSGGGSTRAVIGACYDGPFGVDLRQDGPHALIAGTTGAGKSELLQTMIASLACANRPDEMTFVLVDYKGGSAFSGCAHLPHVTGLVTDLDAHLTQRALASLSAELTRREKVLAAAGAKDIEEYTERGDLHPGTGPCPGW